MFKNLNLNNGAGGGAREAPPPAPVFKFFGKLYVDRL
jgi:hypothetical protein